MYCLKFTRPLGGSTMILARSIGIWSPTYKKGAEIDIESNTENVWPELVVQTCIERWKGLNNQGLGWPYTDILVNESN